MQVDQRRFQFSELKKEDWSVVHGRRVRCGGFFIATRLGMWFTGKERGFHELLAYLFTGAGSRQRVCLRGCWQVHCSAASSALSPGRLRLSSALSQM